MISWMRSTLVPYAISLFCFCVIGLTVVQLYATGYDSVTNHWSVDPLPLPLALLAGLFGLMTYFPFILFAANGPMLVAPAIFTFFSVASGARRTHPAWGIAMGAVAGLMAAVVTRIPEVELTTVAWWQGTAVGCLMAGGVAGGIASRLSRATPPAEPNVELQNADTAQSVTRHRVFAQLAATFLIALLAAGIAMDFRQSSRDDVRVRRDATNAALALRAAPVDQQAQSIARLLAASAAKASIRERTPTGDGRVIRPVQDSGEIATEMALLRTLGGPSLSTHYQGFAPIVGKAIDGYSMLFIDQHAHGETRETLVYRLQEHDTVLTHYDLGYEGRGGDATVKSLHVSP